MKRLLLIFFVFANLIPFGVLLAEEESDPCMGDDPVSPVLAHYYKEFKQPADSKVSLERTENQPKILKPNTKNALANYYTEFLK